jgi:putative sigma-54 modulation protein
MYASIDAASDRIERQLKKHKDKLHSAHKSNGVPHNLAPAEVRHQVFDLPEGAGGPARRLVKTEEFQAKPMSVDEAILQLDLLDAKFFVFQNERDRAVNVVYRREDGGYGLIEART